MASFGLPRNAELYALTDLAAEMHARHPLVGMRLIGQNSVEVADAIRAGALEAGLVVLPVDDDGLDIEPVIRDEVLYATADPERAAAPVTIEALREARLVLYDAHYGNNDPTRRQVNERLQQLGGRLEPHIEVEYLAGALRLAAMGVGDTIVARAAVDGGLLPEGLLTTPFAEPLYDTLAVAKQRHLPLVTGHARAALDRAGTARAPSTAGATGPLVPCEWQAFRHDVPDPVALPGGVGRPRRDRPGGRGLRLAGQHHLPRRAG